MLSIKSSLRKDRYSLMSSGMLYIVPARVPVISRRHTLNSEEKKEGTGYSGGRCGRLFHGHEFSPSRYIVPPRCPFHPDVESIFPSFPPAGFVASFDEQIVAEVIWSELQRPSTFTLLACF